MPEDYKILAEEKIQVTVRSRVRLLEEAIELAHWEVVHRFGIDDAGYADKVEGWSRSTCSINLEFLGFEISMGMGGWNYNVSFKATAREFIEDEEE